MINLKLMCPFAIHNEIWRSIGIRINSAIHYISVTFYDQLTKLMCYV